MKLIDTFLFSEAYENEILLAKFHLEDSFVSEWILIENAYTFQGDYKGLFATQVIDSDKRFDPFKSKIKIISSETVYPKIDNASEGIHDHIAFNAEFFQRELSKDYIFEKYEDGDFVFISDTDEMIDCEDLDKKNFLIAKMKQAKDGIVCMPKTVYAFDFDNQWMAKDRSTAIFRISYLKESQLLFSQARRQFLMNKIQWPLNLHFEFTSCFSIEHIYRKCSTFSHAGTALTEIQEAMLCNHMPISKSRGGILSLDAKNWYIQIPLTKQNSPRYIRENLTWLKLITLLMII
jgi:hypothetical protein